MISTMIVLDHDATPRAAETIIDKTKNTQIHDKITGAVFISTILPLRYENSRVTSIKKLIL